ncbi:hypothetical protein DOM21_05850 [Bacteriovorax stolpii]|uniref:Uncharacterized protein n=1 Tax=Bacteriovorax stolpii TaxID=960 RepID=A0A2K9NU22_BACTC|nr:hypothetical protein [Bacteriovorax stolpii]AUN99019.1 hypothetical protein C0V70_13090 [Bacteriovorax stolpii]QDK40985.1 hypothetical protein DOM21_05850 [Bacteriovorax stolpii]TDP55455.1 hypothetical protein C8D79_0505 [Bacteriovorax stolpii]
MGWVVIFFVCFEMNFSRAFANSSDVANAIEWLILIADVKVDPGKSVELERLKNNKPINVYITYSIDDIQSCKKMPQMSLPNITSSKFSS